MVEEEEAEGLILLFPPPQSVEGVREKVVVVEGEGEGEGEEPINNSRRSGK